MTVTLPGKGFGLTWVSPSGRELITKSVAPSFVFVDYETYVNTNIDHRLGKRGIDSYVSVNAPLILLASIYGWEDVLAAIREESVPLKRAMDYSLSSIEQAAEQGADAIIVCDDICGVNHPVIDPLFTIAHLLPLYEQLAQKAQDCGLPAIFHAQGDVREYYSGLATAGFSGVHVSHPKAEQVRLLMQAVRDAGMVPLGGILPSDADRDVSAQAAFVAELCGDGDLLVCDDASGSTGEDWEFAIAVMTQAREAVES